MQSFLTVCSGNAERNCELEVKEHFFPERTLKIACSDLILTMQLKSL